MNEELKMRWFAEADLSLRVKRIFQFWSLFGMFYLLALPYGVAQTTNNPKVTINERNVLLSTILDELQTKSGYSIITRDNNVNLDKKVSVKVSNKSVEEILKTLFAGTDINTKYRGNRS